MFFICYLFSEGSLESCYVGQAGIKLVILLPQHLSAGITVPSHLPVWFLFVYLWPASSNEVLHPLKFPSFPKHFPLPPGDQIFNILSIQAMTIPEGVTVWRVPPSSPFSPLSSTPFLHLPVSSSLFYFLFLYLFVPTFSSPSFPFPSPFMSFLSSFLPSALGRTQNLTHIRKTSPPEKSHT